MEVWTDAPGLQYYTGNFLDMAMPEKKSDIFKKRNGFCFEFHCHPNAINEDKFPSIILNPGNVYESCTLFQFSVL